MVFITSIGIAILNPAASDSFNEEDTGFSLAEQVIGLPLYGLYMFATEAIFKGKSLGKLIIRTRVVNEDGSNITPKAAMLSGLSRAVPFNALGPPNPWHYKWANTYVIDEKGSNRPAN